MCKRLPSYNAVSHAYNPVHQWYRGLWVWDLTPCSLFLLLTLGLCSWFTLSFFCPLLLLRSESSKSFCQICLAAGITQRPVRPCTHGALSKRLTITVGPLWVLPQSCWFSSLWWQKHPANAPCLCLSQLFCLCSGGKQTGLRRTSRIL